jgi:ribonuclease VapC
MVIDTSAIVAILCNEVEMNEFLTAILQAPKSYLSAANFLEVAMVIGSRYGQSGEQDLDSFIREAQIEIYPVTETQVTIARQAFRLYGKGKHPAGLNFGDCFAYALAKNLNEPLLFKGNDFSQTDIESYFEIKS